jgi:predicted enzyme related to lactoylglutathione lyase
MLVGMTDAFTPTLFSPFGDPATTGMDYRVAALVGSDVPFGGVVGAAGAMPGHAIFHIAVAVADVAAARATAEQLGGKVVNQVLEPASSFRGIAKANTRR